jgi:hypothetical protein
MRALSDQKASSWQQLGCQPALRRARHCGDGTGALPDHL